MILGIIIFSFFVMMVLGSSSGIAHRKRLGIIMVLTLVEVLLLFFIVMSERIPFVQ